MPDRSQPFPLTILRADHPTHTPEAEMAVVERHGERVVVVLDDGVFLDMDAVELAYAIGASGVARQAA